MNIRTFSMARVINTGDYENIRIEYSIESADELLTDTALIKAVEEVIFSKEKEYRDTYKKDTTFSSTKKWGTK